MFMKKWILIFLLTHAIAGAQTMPREILFIPWKADSMGNVYTTLDPEGRVGPQNFKVDNGCVYLLDQQNRVINQYSGGRLVNRLPVPRSCRDFIIQNNNSYTCLADNSIIKYKDSKPVEIIRPSRSLPLIRKITERRGEIIALNHNGTASKVKDRQLAKIGKAGEPADRNRYELKKLSRAAAQITVYDDNGNLQKEIDLAFEDNNLGSFNLIGADQQGRIFLDVDLIVQEIPLRVRREVRILSEDGTMLGRITIPSHYYAMMWNDMRLSENGILYHMVSSEDGIHILEWDVSQINEDGFRGVYPNKYQKYLHYNDTLSPEPLEKKSPLSKPGASVTRAEALAIGDTYVVHSWTATAANITNGLITDADGNQLRTPSWVQVGKNYKVPYKWGGFNTLPEYDQGLSDGKSAGDNATADVSRFAVGVDCSGFVSRCWKLSSHYSTRMMDDYIAQAYSSWEDLKPGDAIHKPGHVRLAVNNNPDGSILAVEAAGSSTDWRVDYRTYNYSALSDYTPRYYINMTGPAFPIAQPVLLSTMNDSRARLTWSLSSSDNISGIRINYSVDGENWETLLGDSLIPPAVTEYGRDWTDGPFFIQLESINNDDGIAESLPSDVYGFYTPPSCTGKVLIVDGFDRDNGSWGLPYHPFAGWMGKVLAELKVSFETVANETVIAGDVNLSDYRAVYWILGDESTVDETFSTAEQSLVADYLKNGGQLFVSGSEIAWDLYGQSDESVADKAFLLNYLHADYKADDSEDYTVSGTTGGIFEGLSFSYDDGNDGIYQEDYPDVIAPKSGAVACLNYSGSAVAGIQFEGTFPDGSASGKLVYFGFPWETITDGFQRKNVLKKVSEWFGFTCAGIEPENPIIPREISLSNGYPNPFNSRINFKLDLKKPEPFDVYIYNSRGKLVNRINYPAKDRTTYLLTWDGRSNLGEIVASGVYFFRIVAGYQSQTKKIVFLK
ncbi:MAG: hypothetical protein DRP96_04540 [Candidatus Neomarinimicrobiota bacterium]|nr:MAG: hypothetical protein DRP96_04540 [Candidatus Neomarinimicrobiota bacterium]